MGQDCCFELPTVFNSNRQTVQKLPLSVDNWQGSYFAAQSDLASSYYNQTAYSHATCNRRGTQSRAIQKITIPYRLENAIGKLNLSI